MNKQNVCYIYRKPKIPLEDGTEIYEEQQSDIDELNAMRASTHLSKTTIDLPQTAVAGVSGKMVQKFEEMQDTRPRVVPKSHCWTPTGDLYVGCEGGQLLKVGTHLLNIRPVFLCSDRYA